MTTFFHYTKGYNVGLIIEARKIQPMTNSRFTTAVAAEDCVWFTKEVRYPVMALPRVPDMLESHLEFYLMHKGIQPDMLSIAARVGGIWRFKFDKKDLPSVSPWYGSHKRKMALQTPFGLCLDVMATKVGDRTECWAFSKKSISIDAAVLQQLTPQGWADRVNFAEVSIDSGSSPHAAFCQKVYRDSVAIRQRLGMSPVW